MASPRIIAETLYNEFEKKLAKSDEIDSFWHYQELKPIQKAHSKVKEVEGAPDTILLGDLVQSDEKGNENKKIISLLKRQAVLAEPKAGELTLEKKIEVAKASIEKLRNPDENNKVIQERLKQLQSATENARNDFNSFKNDNEKIIKSIEEQIRPIADEVKPIEDTIKQKENEIKQKEDEIKQKENEIKQKVGAIKKKEYDINNIKINIQKLEKNISARSSSKKNQDLTNQVVMLEAKLVKLQEEKKALAIIIKPIIKPMQDQKKLMQENVKQMQEQVKPLQEQVKPLQEQLKSMHVQVNRIKDQVARKKLVFAEAQWEEKKATTDPNEIIKSERSKQLKILTALESDQKIKKQGVLTINDLKQIADFQEAAKNRAEKHTAIIHRFIELKYPELTDPKTKFHYSAEISAEYKR
ncbi:MAG: hypothetical protein JO131_10005, partial [Gammaproteobacteria bacterium]|nr:hypothetical protein [Gammaproteobacteria bacterium]